MKKKHLVLLAVLLCSFGIYSFINYGTHNRLILSSPPAPQTNNNIYNKFILSAMNSESDTGYTEYYRNLDSLEFNLAHKYLGAEYNSARGRETPKGRTSNDKLDSPVSRYKTEVTNILDRTYDRVGRSIVCRPKIEWLCYGQSSTYQCEAISSGPLWFYSFNYHGANTENVLDSGSMVRHCGIPSGESVATPGYVVKRLKANTEQSERITGTNNSTYKGDSRSTWSVKPRIRIPESYVTNHLSDTVCRIEVVKQDGTTSAMKVGIIADYFRQNGTYHGEYREIFNFPNNTNELIFSGDLGDKHYFLARGTSDVEDTQYGLSHADIKIYWYGKCDMWIDYVKVENEVAQELFSGAWDTRIEDEVREIGMHQAPGASEPAVLKFYVELLNFNNLACVKYVNHKIDSFSNHTISLMHDFNFVVINHVAYHELYKAQTADWVYENWVQPAGFKEIFAEAYPMTSIYKAAYPTTPFYSKIPSTLPLPSNRDTILADTVSPETYDDWLNDNLNHYPYLLENQIPEEENPYTEQSSNPCDAPELPKDAGNFRYFAQLCNEISREHNIPFIAMPQVHQWYIPTEVRREPTNEEIDMMTNTQISYGAKGFIYFWFESFGDLTLTCPVLSKGIVDKSNNLITKNLYGQAKPKWEVIRDVSRRVKKWEPYIMNFTNSSIHSYIYSSEAERGGLLGTYFNDIITLKSGTGSPPCEITDTYAPGMVPDCPNERYIQAAVFEKSGETNTKYFMIVNRRCAPIKAGRLDGKRFVVVKFDANPGAFSGFNNWEIIDLENNSTVLTFDKRIVRNLDLGWFDPGQGRLYKVVPVMVHGGALVDNEEINNVTIDLDTTINTNGKNLTIGSGVNINFKTNAKIEMNGGNFICGTVSEAYNAPKSVTLQAQSGTKWGGIVLENMDTIHIQNTEVKDVDADASNHGYGISLINAKVINIDNCNVINTSSSGAGIQVNYVTNLYMSPDINITGNTIKISTDTCDGIYIHPYSWLTLSPYIYGNKIINTSSGGGDAGIFGFSLEGTPIKNNYIENFRYGIMTWYSSLDLFENTIDTKSISNGWDLYGIVSEYNLSNAYESRLGGSNVLTTYDGRNICLDALDLNIGDGNNIFNVTNTGGYHIAGYFPTKPSTDKPLNALGNCFRIEGFPCADDIDIKRNVTWIDLTPVVFDFPFTSCPENPTYCDYYLGSNSSDTIWIECTGGMGGGHKEISKLERAFAPQTITYREIYDSLNINMRKRQYDLAAEKCMTLLDNYPDSSNVINCVDKLYCTALARNKVSELKSYYESFIQNHPNSAKLIQRMFYYIQKSKAKLGEYVSAMQGFQTIMNEFPTSFEGLAAKWDYMATQLLDSLQGQGGGEKEILNNEQLTDEQQHERLVNLVEDPLDKYDKKKFSKQDRKIIVTNIVNSFEDQKTKETKKIKELEIKVIKNEANDIEKKEYKTKKTLKEIVRPQRVNTVSEHIIAVQNDIMKVFPAAEKKGSAENKNTSVPLEYKLNQNYPNPFNPTTKINYELKNAGFVSLKIYDLLGRELAELVNEVKDAGRYTIDFNSSKYMMASGIYFYRITAGEFVDTKRMVLVK